MSFVRVKKYGEYRKNWITTTSSNITAKEEVKKNQEEWTNFLNSTATGRYEKFSNGYIESRNGNCFCGTCPGNFVKFPKAFPVSWKSNYEKLVSGVSVNLYNAHEEKRRLYSSWYPSLIIPYDIENYSFLALSKKKYVSHLPITGIKKDKPATSFFNSIQKKKDAPNKKTVKKIQQFQGKMNQRVLKSNLKIKNKGNSQNYRTSRTFRYK